MTSLRLYSKPPVAGRTKSRLASSVGPDAAAALHAAFLDDLVARLVASGVRVVLDVTERHPTLDAIATRFGIEQTTQVAGDLGTRMSRSIADALTDDAKVLVVGSDLPLLPMATVHEAVDYLDRVDVVFAPTPDGGFGLVGARRPISFDDVRWSTPHALADSLASIGRHGMSTAVLAQVRDVDDETDLRALRAALTDDPELAPRTARAIAEMERTGTLR